MGGEIALVSSVLGLASSVMASGQQSDGSDRSAEMAAERKAQEEEQRQREAAERKQERDKVTESRELERKRLATSASRQTTLSNGGAGLLTEPEVAAPRLKTKFGE